MILNRYIDSKIHRELERERDMQRESEIVLRLHGAGSGVNHTIRSSSRLINIRFS